MRHLKRILFFVIAVFALTVAASASSVTATTANIGGSTAQVVYVTPSSSITVKAVIANGKLGTTAPGKTVAESSGENLVAAINGNFFNCWYDKSAPLSVSQNNYPRIYGAIVKDGVMINSGTTVALGITENGAFKIGRATFHGVVTLNGREIDAWAVNATNSSNQACYVLTPDLALGVDLPLDAEVVIIRNGVVERVQNGTANFRTPNGTVAFVMHSGCYARGLAEVGDPASYSFADAEHSDVWCSMENIIGGTGMIVENGVSAVDNNPTVTAEDQKPDTVGRRSFAAVLSDGRLMLATVNGSYRAIAKSLIAMGVTDAMTLDGGASSMLYANGRMLYAPGREMASLLAVIEDPYAAAKTPSSWAAADVREASSLGIAPESLQKDYTKPITRGEFCQLIGGYLEAKYDMTLKAFCRNQTVSADTIRFTDTSDDTIRCIAALGVVTGYPNGSFAPGNPISRQDAAIMLRRLAEVEGITEEKEGQAFRDAASISDYAKAGVAFVSAWKLMNGHANGNFAPKDSITREQAITTIMNAWRSL